MNKRPSIRPIRCDRTTTAPNGSGSYGGYSYKVGPSLFLIDVTGRDKAAPLRYCGGAARGSALG